jgi:hypothetical protein
MTRPANYSFTGDSGSSTAGLAFGGYSPGVSALTEEWNGTSWVEVNDLNTARGYLMGSGTTTASLAVAGSPDGSNNTTATEEWTGAGSPVTVTFTDS